VNARKGVAVAVNGNVIPASQWSDHVLSHNDKLMIIKATQGG
jgi:sulfur carrier protein